MSNDFAVIQTGGKQYRVSAGQTLKIEKLPAEKGGVVVFDKVLLRANGDEAVIGMPYIAGAKVEGKVLRQAKEDTKIVFKYHSKARYKKKKGHRQPFTEVEIVKI
jgi:large subunit ribosomal protein L21